ncbi:PREDICTED: uncharacterized protein LOC106741295 [Dinoponera quadriceps]|uniref:Uncharacterized protein LOC106741295 n=1 Tax=Dinoponera quadriceps TaxID=609295 RepID=A0A6P3WR68_DINQU|nr:PREDICTED: uncharacterized protein LOC106741295 [Dinoponera quadriceps]XP_014468596.1 PREDICTED: uncharacterized protein LOC106741295 [Dinoponera quadriceps]
MGKNKGNRKNKNVFKVATVRSIKLKAKAQKVVSNLKKLDVKGSKTAKKDKTPNVDQLLEELRKDVQGSGSKAKVNTAQKKHTKTNKKPLVPKIAPEQTNSTAAMVEQMQL